MPLGDDWEVKVNVVANTDFRTMVVQELEEIPDEAMPEILDFVRFLKQQLSGLTPEERFDRAWMLARRIAAERDISDADIASEVAAVRQAE
jgi:hypothetical protein